MQHRDPEEEELEQAANKADPAQGFHVHEPTADELDADDGYVGDGSEGGSPEPHDERGTVDEDELADEEGLAEDELAEET
jgi:hypothetical protein